MLTVLGCVTQDHDWRLLLLAVLICGIAATTALGMLGRAGLAAGRTRWAWVGAAAGAFGGGVWATHFIAMLAYRSPLPIEFALGVTLASILTAIAGALPAFHLLARPTPGLAARITAGLILGASIAAMHYLGMTALRIPGELLWNHSLVLASLAAGLSLSICATLLLGNTLHAARRLAAAALLVLAICGLHFTGMAAITLLPDGGPHHLPLASTQLALATAIAVITLLLLLISQLGSLVDRRFSDNAARQARRLRQLADASFEGVLIHADGVVLDVNRALCRLLGRPSEAILGRPLAALFGNAHLPALLGEASGTSELDLQLPGGAALPVEIRTHAIDHDDRPAKVLLLRDLRERRAAEYRIQHLAHHDALTGLANRFLFNDRLAQAITRANARSSVAADQQVAVLYLDLDRFKPVNDMLGHPAGDLLLQRTADRLRAEIGPADTVARLGGDEFAVIQTGQRQPGAAAILGARLIARLAAPYEIDGHQISIAASIGVAIFPSDATTSDELLQQADIALYRAKHEARRSGTGTVRFFEPEMDQQVRQRRQLVADLRGAIGSSQMELHYQPLHRGDDRSIIGYEALLRWHHPRQGWISPAAFVPLAEETGLIQPLGEWVLRTACAQAVQWDAPLSVAVNLSPVQFHQTKLVESVASALAASGLPASRLELEVTEGVLIDNAEQALTTLHRLKALGVSISLDDFGTGYSSLSYLSRFPFDKIKIDQSFVRDMLHDPNARAIVEAVIGLGRTLLREVVAEGVETAAQADFLRSKGCDQLQGFLLGRPRPAADLLAEQANTHMPPPATPAPTALRHA